MEFDNRYSSQLSESRMNQEILRKEFKYDDVKKLKKLKIFFSVMHMAQEVPKAFSGSHKVSDSKWIHMIIMSYPDHLEPPTRQRHFCLTEELFLFLKEHGVRALDLLIAQQERGASCGGAIEQLSCLVNAGVSLEDLCSVDSLQKKVKRRV